MVLRPPAIPAGKTTVRRLRSPAIPARITTTRSASRSTSRNFRICGPSRTRSARRSNSSKPSNGRSSTRTMCGGNNSRPLKDNNSRPIKDNNSRSKRDNSNSSRGKTSNCNNSSKDTINSSKGWNRGSSRNTRTLRSKTRRQNRTNRLSQTNHTGESTVALNFGRAFVTAGARPFSFFCTPVFPFAQALRLLNLPALDQGRTKQTGLVFA